MHVHSHGRQTTVYSSKPPDTGNNTFKGSEKKVKPLTDVAGSSSITEQHGHSQPISQLSVSVPKRYPSLQCKDLSWRCLWHRRSLTTRTWKANINSPKSMLEMNGRRQVWRWFAFPLVCWSVFPLHTPCNCESTHPQPRICCWAESQSQERDKHKNMIFEGWTTALHIPLRRMQSILLSQADLYLQHLKTTHRGVVSVLSKFVLQNCLCWPKHKVAWKETVTSTTKTRSCPQKHRLFFFSLPMGNQRWVYEHWKVHFPTFRSASEEDLYK